MPFTRPGLAALQNSVANDIAASLPGSDALLRFSNLGITGHAQAGLAHLHYGYLDWIAKQAVPLTCTDEYLEGWAALKGVFRLPASSAKGAVTFTGQAGTLIPAQSVLVRGDGANFTTDVAATIAANGTAVVTATAVADPSGLSGAFGNTALGSTLSLAQSIAGVQASGVVSTAFVGGADIERDDAFRNRMLFAYQNTPQGGARADYEAWAKAVPGVTRAWCVPNAYGAGTVVVYVMLDMSNAASKGFPVGTNGVAAGETRAIAAAGDQLAVANYILPLQPVTSLVYVVAPAATPVNLSISGVPLAQRASVQTAIESVFFNYASAAGGSTPIAYIWSAIAGVAGVSDFVVTSPLADIVNAPGTLPTVGVITFV